MPESTKGKNKEAAGSLSWQPAAVRAVPEDEMYLEILKTNLGFDAPEPWVPYAQRYHFQRVPAAKLRSCPDCGSEALSRMGQYVYYSNLCQLLLCDDCDLVFSDTRLHPAVIAGHFEQVHKDEDYFTGRRQAVFDQVIELAAAYAAPQARVLDIGGAKGHLMAGLKARRPDLDVTVNDLSQDACDHSRKRFGLKTIPGPLANLQGSTEPYDLIALIDVIYYEPDIKAMWPAISSLLKSGGVAILRIPNHSWIVRASERAKDLFLSMRLRRMSVRVTLFNPEHIYVFSRRYLRRRFAQLGLADCRFVPARLMASGAGAGAGRRLLFALASGIARLSRGRIVLTPSQIVIVTKET